MAYGRERCHRLDPFVGQIGREGDDLHTEGGADPGNGGNRDGAAWAMIGYDPRVPR